LDVVVAAAAAAAGYDVDDDIEEALKKIQLKKKMQTQKKIMDAQCATTVE
jgi:hypothetical protein